VLGIPSHGAAPLLLPLNSPELTHNITLSKIEKKRITAKLMVELELAAELSVELVETTAAASAWSSRRSFRLWVPKSGERERERE
jgi:hypothetical protein